MASLFEPEASDSEKQSLLGNVPLLNRILGGGAHFRTTQLFRRKANNGQVLKAVLAELEADDGVSRRYVVLGVLMLLAHFIYGTVAIMILEGWSFPDAAYFAVVTMTTVGYGDLSPTSKMSKIFVIAYVIISIAIVSSYLAYFVGLFLDEQENLLVSKLMDEEARGVEEGLGVEDYRTMAFGLVLLTVVTACGVSTFMVLEGLEFIDAVYATVISATTVGFGDLHPTKAKTKLCVTVWLVLSTISVAKVVADFTEVRMSVKERAVTRRVLSATVDRQSMKMLDHDNDGTVLWGEYLSRMLVSLGKVSQEEIDSFRKRFNELDIDLDGRIDVN